MKKAVIISLILLCGFYSDAQVWMGSTIRIGAPRTYRRGPGREPVKYNPSVDFSIGYGFPNLDKNLLSDFYGYYRSNASQTGPVSGSIDYQYSKYNSIGILATYGKASVLYNSYGTASSVTGNIESWSVMLNLINYMPGTDKVNPYLRTAIGINSATINYLYNDGTHAFGSNSPSDLAYQVSLGAKFGLSKKSSFFIEAGYGKYILQGCLSFKF
jgi:predicted porin